MVICVRLVKWSLSTVLTALNSENVSTTLANCVFKVAEEQTGKKVHVAL